MCAPRFEKVFIWIALAWTSLKPELIVKSFTENGIGARSTSSFHNYLKEALENGTYKIVLI